MTGPEVGGIFLLMLQRDGGNGLLGVRMDNPLLRVQTASGEPLDVRHVLVRLELGRLWDIRLKVLASNPNIDFEAIVGREASLEYDLAGGTVTWPGFCASVGLVKAETEGLSEYELQLCPRFYFSSLDKQNRIFQDKSAVDIARQLLEEWNVEAVFEISEPHEPLEYRVQYRESTFNFFCRILEQDGITFHYREGGQMVVTDAPESVGPREPMPFAPTVTFHEENLVKRVRYTRNAVPGRYAVVDHDLTRPADFALEASDDEGLDNMEDQVVRVHYVPGAFLVAGGAGALHDEGRGRTLASNRLSAKRLEAQRVHLETTQYGLRPGETFHLLDHPHDHLHADHKLLVTTTKLTMAFDETWVMEAEVVRADRPYRPPLRAKLPKADGLEHATVVGPPGEEIHTDERGRLKIHFHWDREGARDGRDTCWVQLVQSWSGPGFGAAHVPRIGHEVIVEFIGGNPDRPLVTGTVFTGPNVTAVGLPDDKTVSGFRTQSTNGTGGSNHLLFEDRAGRELVSTRAQRDQQGVVNRVMNEAVGMLRSELVGRVKNAVVGLFSNESVGISKSIEAGSLIKLHVGTSIIAIEPEKITISADVVEVIGDPIKLN